MPLKSGDIIHAYIDDIYPPKHKYLCCVCVSDNLFLAINTENRAIYMCEKIEHADYPFLNGKDRYVSCNKFFSLSSSSIRKSKIISSLKKKDKIRIYNKIQESPKISKIQKDISISLLTT